MLDIEISSNYTANNDVIQKSNQYTCCKYEDACNLYNICGSLNDICSFFDTCLGYNPNRTSRSAQRVRFSLN
jgi:hypothetical protein